MTQEWVDSALREADAGVLDTLSASAQPLPPPDSPIVVSAVRNERLRIETFLAHYRAAGIRRFCFIDNDSTDGTPDYLATQPDVDLFGAARTYSSAAKQGWICAAVRHYGEGRWFLYLDADELVVFDGIETHGFDALARLMASRGVTRLRGILLDMYPGGAIGDAAPVAPDRLLDAVPFHHAGGFTEIEVNPGMSIGGGPRQRMMAGQGQPGAQLNKVPMFHRLAGELPVHAHYVWPFEGNATAPRHLALLHLKFLPDIRRRAEEAMTRGGFYNNVRSYRSIAETLDADPALSLLGKHSRRYEGSRGLVEAGLIAALPWEGEVAGPPPDGAVSSLSAQLVPGPDAELLKGTATQTACVFGVGPEAVLLLRDGRRRVIVVEPDAALAAAFTQRPVARDALAAGTLSILVPGTAAEGPTLPWPAWAAEGAWPDLVLVTGRHRVACALATLREAAARGVPAERVAIVFLAWHRPGPGYAGLRPFVTAVARGPRLALLRPREGLDPAALEAAFAAHRDDPR